MRFLDDFLNNVTMYRLLLYILILLLVYATILCFLKLLAFNPLDLVLSTLFILVVCYLTNSIFAKTFNAIANFESVYITALILALIITPANSVQNLVFLGWAAVWSQAAKYIFAIGKKHLFNPVAIAVVITAYGIGHSASWWVGNPYMFIPVLAGGFLIVKKIRRFNLLVPFLIASLTVILGSTIGSSGNLPKTLQNALFISPLVFFATVMLTEPQTTPPTKTLQIVYGALVGILFAPQFHIRQFYTTPEVALIVGNIFSYFVSSKKKLTLALSQKIKLSENIYNFVFALQTKFVYQPGQYLEWTIPSKNSDARGNRRYFTIASSPTEPNLQIGVKFYPNSSTFKKTIFSLPQDTQISASQLAGDFILPKNPSKKLVFIAGGIGITPYRSMIKYLLDKNEKRDIILFYATKTADEIVYGDILEEARQKIGLQTVYILSDTTQAPQGWQGKIGYLNEQMIIEIPDYKSRTFYISGPQKMVETYKETLLKINIPNKQIKTDYFPGF